MKLHKNTLIHVVKMLGSVFATAALVGCDGCAPEPEECPSDYVYANGEAITEWSTWNHAQLSSKPDEDHFTSLLPQREGGVIVSGPLAESAYIVFSTAGGTQRNGTTQVSDFSPVTPVAIGFVGESAVVTSVVRAVFIEDGIERVGISGSAVESDGGNPFTFTRSADIAAGLSVPLDDDTQVLAEIPQTAAMATERLFVFGAMELQTDGDDSTVPFIADFNLAGYARLPPGQVVVPQRVRTLSAIQDRADVVDYTFHRAVETETGVLELLVNVVGTTGSRSEIWTIGAEDEVTLRWSSTDISTVPDAEDTEFRALHRDSAGGLLLAGTLDSAPVVVRLDDDGVDWVQALSAVGDEELPAGATLVANDVAELSDGMLLAVGTLDVPGEGDLEGHQIVYMAELDRLTGIPAWMATYKDTTGPGEFVTGMAVAPDGDTGSFWIAGETNFEHSRIRGYGGGTDHYVHRFEKNGREWGYRTGFCEAWLEERGLGDPDTPIQ